MSTDEATTATLTTTIERTKTVQHPSEGPGLWNSSTSGLGIPSLSGTMSLSSSFSETTGPVKSQSSETFTGSSLDEMTQSMSTTSSSISGLVPMRPNATSSDSSDIRWTLPTVVSSISASTSASTSTSVSISASTSMTDPPTITTLPPEATLITPTGITLTTPHYITTTSPGGSDPTIVPVIFPFVGPPVICFGCYIKFPPNIAINVPQFCIQLLGIKIGNCPADDKNEDKKDDNDDKKDDDNDTNNEDEEDKDGDDDDDNKESSKTGSTTSTSSCTVTVTATQRTVFCSITRSRYDANLALLIGVDAGTPARTAASTTCLTSAYTTVTGCSVLESITTVTTTRSSTPTSVPICGPDCGSGSCPAPGSADIPEQDDPSINLPWKADLPDLANSKAVRRGEPHRGEWVDPSDYHQGYSDFMMEEFRYMRNRRPATPEASYHNPKLVLDGPSLEDEDENLVTVRSNWVMFRDKVETLAIEGLTGCTVVLVVSQKGAWMGKFYEATMMEERLFDDAMFQWMFGPEEDQDRFTEDKYKYSQYAIDDLRNHPERGKLGTLFGNADEMEDGEVPPPIRALIVTPRVRGKHWYPDGTLVDTAITHNFMGNIGDLLYDDQIERIKEDLVEAIPQISTSVVDYPPVLLTHEEMTMRNRGTMNEAVWAVVLSNRIRQTPRGKVMLQYHPAKTCYDKAGMRWWVDALPMLGDQFPDSKVMDEWEPEYDQIFGEYFEGAAPAARRQASAACPIRSMPASSAGSASSLSTGQGTPGKPTSPGASGGGTQPIPTGSSSLDGTRAPTPWNNSMTTALSGSGGSRTWLLPTSLSASNKSTTSTRRSESIRTTLSGNSTVKLPPTTSWSLNGTMVPVPGANSTVLSSNLATLNKTTTGTSTALIETKTKTSANGASTSQSTMNKTPSIHTTIYVAPPTWSIASSSSTASSTPTVKRVIVTASVVETVTVAPSIVTSAPETSQPPPPPKPDMKEAVLVMLENGGVVFTEMWVMLPVRTDTTINHCDVSNIGYKITDTSSSDRSWPPSISAKRGSNAFGLKNCKYEARTAGFGSLSCDGDSKMNCIKDPEYDKGWEVKSYTSRMRCMIRKE
ncbi:LOW QUALITY PROTEIN: hypothetical protein LZ30DRAFT_754943 [Colletotrichum cereale]|nr:LOW QUALITY PROTEIN: hypothetical protein LZ30DRAFT_754943 [Colletotrichum cereale]